MTKAVFYYDPRLSALTPELLNGIGFQVRRLVANAASTDQNRISDTDVDWVVFPYGLGSIIQVSVKIEIETTDHHDRVAKLMDSQRLAKLKKDILEIHEFPQIKAGQELIWVKLFSQHGQCV